MTYLRASDLPWSIAGNPREQSSKPNNFFAPVFSLVATSNKVISGGELKFQIHSSSDNDGDQITFWWKSSSGKFTYWNSSASSVRWQAPVVTSETIVPIYINASDGRGKVETQVFKISVLKNANADDIITTNVVYTPIVAPAAGNPPVYYPNEDVRIGWNTVNSSQKTASGIMTCLWITANEQVPLTATSEKINVGNLAPNETKQRWTNFYIPKTTVPGYYYIALKNDCDNVVAEANETNNEAFLYIWVRPKGSPRR
ncbi:hypothetical protein KKG71_01385 [Patescibacteria group bacterium]|nr:hypothetical protein [Patescibacteria group bacterium]